MALTSKFMTPSLPMAPAEAIPIAASFSWATIGDLTVYFSNLEPFDCHPAGDVRAMQLRIARLHRVSGVRIVDLVDGFGCRARRSSGRSGCSTPGAKRGSASRAATGDAS